MRSPLLLTAEESTLLIVDVQEKFLEVIPESSRVVWNLSRLALGAQTLEVPRLATEQYPEKLGSTHTELLPFLADSPTPGKMTFSCAGCAEFEQQLQATGRRQVVVAGVETHVCVLQTSLDLLTAGYDVFLVVDAVAARHDIDHQIALRRMEISGVTLTTMESVLFEWCVRAGTTQFKEISRIVRMSPSQ